MRIPVAVLALFAAASLSAQNIRFDPPDPTTRTPVTAHLVGNFTICAPGVQRNGSIISITLNNCLQLPSFPVDEPVDLGLLPAGVYDVVAGFPAILSAIGEGTLVVRDAAPPFQLTPNVLASGGSAVVITGHDLIRCTAGITPPICETPIVKFGDTTTFVTSATPDQIVVHPGNLHPPGPVDVTIDRNGNVLRAIAAFYFAPSDKAPDPAFYERVLFPLSNGEVQSGAFGTQWVTFIYLRNENDFGLDLAPQPLFNLGCFSECSIQIEKHSTRTTTYNAPKGFFAYVPRQGARNTHFEIVARDLSRQGKSAGTEIPVVREKDFYDRPLVLLNVPTDPGFRVALRVYGMPANLTIQPLTRDEKLVSTLISPTGNPPFAQISDLIATYPQLVGKIQLRVTLTPSIPGNPDLWAFISVTNNETQQVTTISPQ